MLSFLILFRRLCQALRRGWADAEFRGLLYLAVGLLVAGMLFYHRVEGWTLLEALYLSVLTLATVGYGDFTPQTGAGRAFTVCYVLVGLGIVVGLVTRIATHAAAARMEPRRRRGEPGPTAQPAAG